MASRTGLIIVHLSAAQYRRAELAAGSTGVRQWATGLILDGIGADARANVKASGTRIIGGCTVRRNMEHPGHWDVMESRAGQLTGKVSFTGTLKEVRAALAIGQKLAKGGAR